MPIAQDGPLAGHYPSQLKSRSIGGEGIRPLAPSQMRAASRPIRIGFQVCVRVTGKPETDHRRNSCRVLGSAFPMLKFR